MTKATNDNGTQSSIIFTDGTSFSSGASTIFGGAWYFHNSYPNLSFVFASDSNSTYKADFSAVCIVMRDELEINSVKL